MYQMNSNSRSVNWMIPSYRNSKSWRGKCRCLVKLISLETARVLPLIFHCRRLHHHRRPYLPSTGAAKVKWLLLTLLGSSLNLLLRSHREKGSKLHVRKRELYMAPTNLSSLQLQLNCDRHNSWNNGRSYDQLRRGHTLARKCQMPRSRPDRAQASGPHSWSSSGFACCQHISRILTSCLTSRCCQITDSATWQMSSERSIYFTYDVVYIFPLIWKFANKNTRFRYTLVLGAFTFLIQIYHKCAFWYKKSKIWCY